jgi:hypothetical protein
MVSGWPVEGNFIVFGADLMVLDAILRARRFLDPGSFGEKARSRSLQLLDTQR